MYALHIGWKDIIQDHFNTPPVFTLFQAYNVYFYCHICDNSFPGFNGSETPHPSHLGNSLHVDGIYVEENFLSEHEENELTNALEAIPWDPSQSGRRKQVILI